MNDIKVSKLQKNQIEELVRVHKDCVNVTNSKFYPKAVIEEWIKQINIKNVLDQFENTDWIVAIKEGKILGFAQYLVEDGYLYQINVHPNFQNQNIGKELYKFVESEFIKQNSKEIKLNATLNSVDFYEHLGFKKIREISFSLNNEELDMVLMIKKL